MGNRNASTSGVSSFNSSPSRIQRPSSASSLRSSSRYRSDRGRSSSSLSNDSYPLSTLNKLHGSGDASPLINKLRAKVASRMMGFKNASNQGPSDYDSMSCHPNTGHRHSTSGPGSLTNSNGNGITNGTGLHGSSEINSGSTGDASGGDPMFPKLKSQSSLTNDQLTAHLTEEERLILQKVFQKEEEFHREALSKRQFKTSTVDKKDGPTLSSSPTQSPSSGSKLVGNCRTCRKKILTNEPCNYCDTCSEPICEDCSSYSDKSKEKLWMCSFCRRRGTQPAVAALTELGLMIPSSLVTGRRRSTIVNMKDSFQQQRRPSSIDAVGRSTPSELPNRGEALARLQTPNLGARYEGRNLAIPGNLPSRRYSSIVVTKERYSSNEGLNERRTSDELKSSTLGESLMRKETIMYRSRDELISMSANESNMIGRSTPPGVSITHDNHRVLGKSFSASDSSLEDYPMDSTSKSTHGSTLEGGELSVLKRRRSQRSRSVHQSNRLMGSDDVYDNSIQSTSLHGNSSNHLSTHHAHPQQAQKLTGNASSLGTTNPILRTSYGALNGPEFWDSSEACKGAKRINKNATNGSANAFNLPIVYNENNVNVNNMINSNMTNNLRHIASDVALYSPQNDNRRKSDSQSSEYSDIRIPSPPQESMSPSSPDYSRSPRESADSDMLGLPTIGPLPTQRRSIPSVLVDNAVDTHHLTLKDCFPRRSSTGRALPRIPSEQSRSLLELPQGRTQSTHSLDLPNPDQPRRASAPEGENITIVIDDVDSAGVRKSNSQIERIILHRDENDVNPRTHGFGLVVMGGKISETDGKLYAYVAYVVPGGSADKMSLKAGDKILEWDRKSLVNCTFEQVCSIIESSQNTAELLIEPYNRTERRGALIHQRRRLSQAFSQSGSDIYSSPPISPSYQGGNRSGRKLPRTPESVQPVGQGEILIQTWVDLERSELVITIICAKGLNNKKPCFARVRIIPEMGFKSCQTELSNGLEWNETVIIQKFPIEKITEMALEIGIWETMGDKPELLGETVIPMESAIAHNTDWWPLLLPQYLCNLARSSSLDTLAVKALTDGFSCLSESKSVPSSRRNSGRSDIIDPLRVINNLNTSASHLHSSTSNISPSRTMSLRIARPSSETLVHHGPIPGPTSANQLVAGSGGMGTPPPSLTVEPPPLSPRRKSASCIASSKMNRSFSLKSNPDTTGGENIRVDSSASSNYHQSVTTNSDSDSEGITSESDSVNTSTISQMGCDLGSNLIVGEIKLGFVMTKGLLEIEVIAARGLPTTHSKQPPDTYVKTYLEESNRHTNKKKTRVVYGSCDPQYRQTLKYDAALIYGRSLLVMVWQKHKGFEHNTPLGAVDVKVNSLELHKLTISWFKLYALNHSP